MNSHIWKIAGRVFRQKKSKSILLILMIPGAILAALIPPLILERMVTELSNKTAIAVSTAMVFLLMFAVSGILESLQNGMITIMGQAVTHEIRSTMAAKLNRLPADYFVKNEAGRITSKMVNDVDAVDTLFSNGIISMIADLLKVFSIMAVIFIKSRGLGILLCIVMPLIMIMTMVFQRRMRRAQLRSREAVAKVNHHVPETIRNIRAVCTYGCESYMERKYDSYIQAGYRAMDQSNFYDAIYSPIVSCVSSLIVAIMMVCSSMGAAVQMWFGITVGSAVAIISYVGKVFEPLENLGMEIQNIQGALAGLTRIDEFLDEKEMPKPAEGYVDMSSDPLIEFDRVDFGYDNRMVLSRMTFDIRKGEYVLFTGRTGAGKSTVFKLLLGLYAPKNGQVRLGGTTAGDIRGNARRKLIGCVEQKFAVVEGTIGNQITLFDPAIEEKAVWHTLEICGLKDKVASIPDNISAQMNPSDFSQGELQLLSIARALVSEPEVMLLDEIAANLDSVTEERILNTIEAVSEGRTVLSISHRMSERLRCVRVIEME